MSTQPIDPQPEATQANHAEIDAWLKAQLEASYVNEDTETLTVGRCFQVLKKCGGNANEAAELLYEIYHHPELVDHVLQCAVDNKCPKCRSGRLELKHRNSDGQPFWGCSKYPSCEYTEPQLHTTSDKPEVESPLDSGAPASPEPSLVFPTAGYVGVPAQIAELYAQHYETPKEFIYMDLLTLIGTMISGLVTVNFGDLNIQPRLYTLKVARSGWSRKSTATEFAEDIIQKALEHGKIGLVEDLYAVAPLKAIYGVGSAEGLIKQFRHSEEYAKGEEKGGKKGQWKGYPRIVLSCDEFRLFEKKARGEGSVLLYALNQLYNRNTYDNATREHTLCARNAHLGFIANTTNGTYWDLLEGSELQDVGFLNRLFIVTSDTRRRIACPVAIPGEQLEPLVAQLSKLFDGLPKIDDDFGKCEGPIRLALTDGGQQAVDYLL